MEFIGSLKQSLKTEINNRKETEDSFMAEVEQATQQMLTELQLRYLNEMYAMRERLAKFSERKHRIQMKLDKLQGLVDRQLQSQLSDLH